MDTITRQTRLGLAPGIPYPLKDRRECGDGLHAGLQEAKVCAACHEVIVSGLSRRGSCSVCGEFICYKCWHSGQRQCSCHSNATVPRQDLHLGRRSAIACLGPEKKTVASCAGCGKPLPRSANTVSARKYCLECQERLCRLPERQPDGAVTLNQARHLESLFHGFLDGSLRGGPQSHTGRSFKRAKVIELDTWHTADVPRDFLLKHPLGDALKERSKELPANRGRLFEVRPREGRRSPFRRPKRLYIAASSYAPLQEMLEHGFIAQPVGLGGLNAALEGVSAKCPSEAVNILFSPAGWSDSIPLPPNVVLVSPSNQGGWDIRHRLEQSDLAGFVEGLFDTQGDAEKIESCVENVKALPVEQFPLSAASVSKEFDVAPRLVLDAFRAIQRNDRAYVLCEDPENNDWLLDFN